MKTTGWFFLYMLFTCSFAGADVLSDLPAKWESVLQPVAEVDISTADNMMRHKIESARKVVAVLLQANKPDTEQLANSWGKLGAFYQLRKIDPIAKACYLNASVLKPDTMRWHYYLAWLALGFGRSAEALAQLEQAQQLDPDYKPLTLRRAEANLALDHLELAKKDFETATREKGLHAAAEFGLGQVALVQRHYQDAVNHFQETLKLDPHATRVHYPLAQALRALGNVEEARNHLKLRGEGLPVAADPLVDDLNELNTGPDILYEQAMNAKNDQHYTEAAAKFAKALQYDPDNHNARVSYARVLYLSGKKQQAREELQQVLKADSNHILALFLMAVLDDAAGNISEATQAYQRILQADPTHDGAQFFLAARLFRDKKYKEAASLYAAAVQTDPDNMPARLFYTLALSHTGNPDNKTRKQLEDILKRSETFTPAGYALTRLLLFSKTPSVANPEKALQLANTLLKNNPIPPVLELQAIAYAASGEFERAVESQLILMQMYGMMAPEKEYSRLSASLEAFKNKQVPDLVMFPETDILLSPAPVDPTGPFSGYPAPNPY